MDVYGYGEDALTLWAFHNRLPALLSQLNDDSSPDDCVLFFRPSFGRRGGGKSAQFGEFDFILLTGRRVYLGEAKWDRASEAAGSNEIVLRPEQSHRHAVFRQYVGEWTHGTYDSWDAFLATAGPTWPGGKPVAPEGSLLSENLQRVLSTIQAKLNGTPEVVDVLLYLYDGDSTAAVSVGAPAGFKLAQLDYSPAKFGHYVHMGRVTGGRHRQ
jgi:hypothetical protein